MPNQIDFVTHAKEIAFKAHEGQTRWNGDPYITHPQRIVAEIEKNFYKDKDFKELLSIAWLHDVIEDTKVTEHDLRKDFSSKIVDAVVTITKKKGEDYFDFILRIVRDPLAMVVKIHDINDNLHNLRPGSLRDKYLLARFILVKFLSGELKASPPLP